MGQPTVLDMVCPHVNSIRAEEADIQKAGLKVNAVYVLVRSVFLVSSPVLVARFVVY